MLFQHPLLKDVRISFHHLAKHMADGSETYTVIMCASQQMFYPVAYVNTHYLC